MDIEEIVETFSFLDPGEERYRYLIDLGKDLEGLPEAERTDDRIVHGCLSRVWMTAEVDPASGALAIGADSDAFIVRGLIAILLAVYDGKQPDEALGLDPAETFGAIGLDQMLSMGRRNGLYSMVKRIRALAAQASAS